MAGRREAPEVLEVDKQMFKDWNESIREAVRLGDEILGNAPERGNSDSEDIGKMNEDELIEFAEKNNIDVPRKCKTEDEIRDFIQEALESSEKGKEESEPEPEKETRSSRVRERLQARAGKSGRR